MTKAHSPRRAEPWLPAALPICQVLTSSFRASGEHFPSVAALAAGIRDAVSELEHQKEVLSCPAVLLLCISLSARLSAPAPAVAVRARVHLVVLAKLCATSSPAHEAYLRLRTSSGCFPLNTHPRFTNGVLGACVPVGAGDGHASRGRATRSGRHRGPVGRGRRRQGPSIWPFKASWWCCCCLFACCCSHFAACQCAFCEHFAECL